METHAQSPSRRLGSIALAAGVLSGVLFAASLLWAHHWNALTLSLVCAWGLAMLGTPPLAIAAHSAGSAPRRANWGASLNGLCWLALPFIGLLLLLGADVPGCGGG
jgi:hypothetical protein